MPFGDHLAERAIDCTCGACQNAMCTGCSFFYGYDPVPKDEEIPDIDQMKKEALRLSEQIFISFDAINLILDRHQDTLQKRWLKKTIAKRSDLLAKAWPGIPAKHRPDFDTLRQALQSAFHRLLLITNRRGCYCPRKGALKAPAPDVYLFPFINLEDLTKPETLLVFLHARARNQPWKFALVDRTTGHTKPLLKSNDPIDARMYLFNREGPKTYGRIYKARKGDTAAKYLSTRSEIVVDASEGLQVLNVQNRILEFLFQCCVLILKDDCLLPNLLQAPCKTVAPVEWPPHCTFADLAWRAPYCLPQQIQLDLVLNLALSRHASAEDHLWALRENPGYFAETVQEWADHFNAHIPDKSGEPCDDANSEDHLAWHATSMIIDAYGSLISWDKVVDCLSVLVDINKRFPSSFDPTKPLHPTFEMTIRELDHLLGSMLRKPLHLLDDGIRGSPTLRGGYQRTKNNDIVAVIDGMSCSKPERNMRVRLHRLFSFLFDYDRRALHGLGNIVEEIQMALDDDTYGLVTSWIAERFTDVAMIVEIQRQIDRFEPWVTIWRNKPLLDFQRCHDCGDKECHNGANYEYDTMSDVLRRMDTYHPEIMAAANPANFRYPKRNTKDTNKQIRQCEANLDAFWEKLDWSLDMTYTILGIDDAFRPRGYLEDPDRKLERTPLWKDPEEPKPKIVRTPKAKKAVPSPILLPLTANEKPTKGDILSATPTRRKIKTHGLPVPEMVVDESPLEPEIAAQPLRIPVSRRALRTFRALFYVSGVGKGAGEIPWNDILYAMAQAGFSVEKLMGSSWMFTPPAGFQHGRQNDTKSDMKSDRAPETNKENTKGVVEDSKSSTRTVTRSLNPIQFHEPHPASKIRIWEVKKMGRRLTGAYGWNGETFVEK